MHGYGDPPVRRGRHRRCRSPSGPLALIAMVVVVAVVAVVAGALATLGGGATLLPSGLFGGQRPDGAAAGVARSASSPALSATAPSATGRPSPTRSATPTRTTAASTASARSKASPTLGREEQVLLIVNRERAANGCAAVKINSRLATAARSHSRDQATHDTMSHTGSDGSSPWDRAERAGYRYAIGENVAAGYRTAAAVMAGWMNSAGHRANILNCEAKAIGIGVAAAGDGTLYWTQLFGSVA